jgi:hypothetical protein
LLPDEGDDDGDDVGGPGETVGGTVGDGEGELGGPGVGVEVGDELAELVGCGDRDLWCRGDRLGLLDGVIRACPPSWPMLDHPR